ncbi:MAG: DNA polymerase IV [Steroidobacteraceae bacterium]
MERGIAVIARTILHVDMDAFYASIEQRDNPDLKGQPVIVGGTGARGVVAAASYEVRRFGVRSAMPMREALQRCPHAVCVAPRMARYREVSRQIFAIFESLTPIVQGLSLDEAFLDITHCQSLHGDARAIAITVKRRIQEMTGLTASVGVAPNRLVAKIASDLDKPDGLTVVAPDQLQAVLDPLPVQRLPGLGRKKGDQVRAAGITTLGQLRLASDAALWPLFGKHSQHMRERAAGHDEREVETAVAEQSISAEETFERDRSDSAQLHCELIALAERVSTRLRARHLHAGTVFIKVRRHDFRTYTRQRPLRPASADSRAIRDLAQELLTQWLQLAPGARIRLLGVGVSDLCNDEQLDLFAATDKRHELDSTVDAVRQRFGGAALRPARLLGDPRPRG